MATHSSVLAWRIPGTGEPGGLPSMGSHRVGHDWSDLAAAAHIFYWWAIARQRGNSKIAPWEKFHRPLEMCQTRSLTFKPNLLDKQIDLSLRKTAGGRGGGESCFSLLSMQCSGGGNLSRSLSLIVTAALDRKRKPFSLQSQMIKKCPLAAATETR